MIGILWYEAKADTYQCGNSWINFSSDINLDKGVNQHGLGDPSMQILQKPPSLNFFSLNNNNNNLENKKLVFKII